MNYERNEPIEVEREVFDGIEAVRHTYRVHMLRDNKVIDIALELGFDIAADWIASNEDLYELGIRYGFEVTQ